MKPLIIIPTYNERDNIGPLLDSVFHHLPQADVLVVDDASPDRTEEVVTARMAVDERVHLLRRAAKEGLGPAYIAGFRWSQEHPYHLVVGMDADFSHHPRYLPQLIDASEHCDVVVGSRYVPGGSTPDWTWTRRAISRIGNTAARMMLRMPVHDCTSAYRCYRREALAAVDFSRVGVVGYSFLIETMYRCCQNNARVGEVPIVFVDRKAGTSKMSKAILLEALTYILCRRWRREPARFSDGQAIRSSRKMV